MGTNNDLIARLATPVYQEIDLGEYATELKDNILRVQVNPPAVIDEIARRNKQDEVLPRESIVVAVTAFIGEHADGARDRIAQWDDAILFWVFSRCMELYDKYHADLRKN